jgi:hypothetical protein
MEGYDIVDEGHGKGKKLIDLNGGLWPPFKSY